jgi:GWxTD domain-containing protein
MATLVRRSLSFLFALLLVGPALHAEGPPVDTRQFPRLVRLLLLPEEASLLKELKNDDDRREFQAIFWARRDPTAGTAANEFEANVRDTWARADQLFAYSNQKGSETGCGQVLALLGRPEEVLGLETRTRFDNLQYLREGDRRAETWIYRDRPGRPFTFTKAELRVAFDSDCRFPEGGILADDLRRAAAALVTRPDLVYTRGADGRLVKLAAQTGGAAGAIDLLTAPRSDFPLAAEASLVLRAPKGEALVAGLARWPRPPTSGRVSLAVRATDAGGQTLATAVRESEVAPLADGSGVASWSLSLKPGRCRVTVAVHQQDTGKGSVGTVEVEVPDFAGATLVASPIVAYADEPPAVTPPDPRDPYAALQVGSRRIHPRFGNVFTPADALMVVATLHGAKLDAASGQASLRSRYSILKDGKPVARGGEDAFTTADAVAAVGPIPLSGYAPGTYRVRLDVTDNVAKQSLRQEAALEIRAAAVAP